MGDALAGGAPIQSVFVDKSADQRVFALAAQIAAAGTTVVPVDGRTIESLSETRSQQGIVAVVGFIDRPVADLATIVGGPAAALVLVLHDLSDPGNAGTLVRCADAFRASAACFGPQAVEPYNAKVVRSSAGGIFRIPIVRYSSWAALRGEFLRCDLRALAADAGGDDVRSLAIPRRCALLVGHERHGLTTVEASDIERRVSIPHAATAESLNAGVAGAILMYEIAKANGLL